MVYKGNQSPIPSGGAGGGFKIHAFGKSELAMMYFPKLSKRAAAQKLRTWVKTNPRLNDMIDPRSHDLKPNQVQAIVDECGEPF